MLLNSLSVKTNWQITLTKLIKKTSQLSNPKYDNKYNILYNYCLLHLHWSYHIYILEFLIPHWLMWNRKRYSWLKYIENVLYNIQMTHTNVLSFEPLLFPCFWLQHHENIDFNTEIGFHVMGRQHFRKSFVSHVI